MTDRQTIENEIARFPKEFGLRAWPCEQFKIDARTSFISDGRICLYLYIRKNGDWQAFCKGTPDELLGDIIVSSLFPWPVDAAQQPFIFECATPGRVTIQATTQEQAERYARNYFGDYRDDYRNTNQVEFEQADFSLPNCNLYIFTYGPRKEN